MCCSLAYPGTSLGEAQCPSSSTAIASWLIGKVIGRRPVGENCPSIASTTVS